MKVIIVGGGIGGLTAGADAACPRHRLRQSSNRRARSASSASASTRCRTRSRNSPRSACCPRSTRSAIRTKELIYTNRFGQKIWSEPRGADAGFEMPQFSIHRGRLQKVIHDAVVASGSEPTRSGPACGSAGFCRTRAASPRISPTALRRLSETVRGEVLVAADGIHSVCARRFYPKKGRPNWQGVMLWRGATEWPQFLTGRSMYIGGGMGAKLASIRSAPARTPESRLTNWASWSHRRRRDAAAAQEDWSRAGPHGGSAATYRRFIAPGVDARS